MKTAQLSQLALKTGKEVKIIGRFSNDLAKKMVYSVCKNL